MKKLLINTVYSLYVCCMAILMPFGLTSCSGDDKPFVDNEPIAVKGGGDVVKGISVTLSDFESADAKTRTAYSDAEGGIKVTWAAGDTIGIFPNEGGQVEFPIQAGTESNEATFDGGGWALRATSTYAAYYPYSKWNVFRDNETVLLDYTGQTQTANGNTDHLGKYDYQATGGVQTNSSGYLNFQFKHMGALMVFKLTVPKAGTYTSLTLTSSEEVFVTKAELDISGSEPVVKPIETSNTFTLSLDDVELESDNSELTAYMMLAPVNLTNGSLELSLKGSTNYKIALTGHPLEVGKQYNINPSNEADTELEEIINFADERVKKICINNWDTNKDGELSYEEAAAVMDIGQIFWYNSNIKSFEEFQYFTGVTSISSEAFYHCSSLESIVIPDGVTSIDASTFSQCSNLTSIVIPEGVTTIGNSAFKDCSSLISIVIPEGVTSIGNNTFSGCSNLTNIKIPEGLTSIESYAFQGCRSLTSIVISNNVTSIGLCAFSGCSSLTSIDIPESVTSIDSNAFSGCNSLTSVFFSEGLTLIGSYAFSDCSSLTVITLPDGLSFIGQRAFSGCSITSVLIPNSVTSIGERAFNNVNGLSSVIVGTGLLTVGEYAFGGYYSPEPAKVFWLPNTPPSGYTNAAGAVNYVANNQYYFSNMMVYPFLSSMFEVDGIKYVPVSPSERTCDAIDCDYDEIADHVNIGETVSYQGVELKVNQLNSYTFYGCINILSVTLSKNIISIGEKTFSGCSSLTDIQIGQNVEVIGNGAFSGCNSIETINIPSSVTSIGNNVFSGCSSLKNVIMEDNEDDAVLSLGYNNVNNTSKPLFTDCPLDEIYIGRNVSYSTSQYSGYSPFYRNTSLRSVTITDRETEISDNEFYGCTNLKNVSIGDGVSLIGNRAFSGCSSLDYFAFGSAVETIGQEAFSDCVNVTKIISRAATPPVCSSQALDDINKWNCTLQVPANSKTQYQAAEQWKEFFFIE